MFWLTMLNFEIVNWTVSCWGCKVMLQKMRLAQEVLATLA